MLAGGIFALVAFILIVMVVPLVQFMRRDTQWEQSKDRSVAAWYARLDK